MPGKGKQAPKPKKQEQSKKGNGKKKTGVQGTSGGSRALISNRRYPKTYFSTEKGGEGEMIIKGHEIIGEVSTNANFNLLIDERLTPLNFKLFPKLSAIARTFEQYHFRDLKFHYVTGCPATTVGSVMHYVEYNTDDAPAVDAIALLANQTAMVSSVSLDNSVRYDVSRQMLPKMFVGSSSSNVNSLIGSPKENYIGNYRLYMDKGAATNAFAGYVYSEYTCCFWTPRPPVPVGGAGSIRTTLTIPPSNGLGTPLNTIQENTGLPGQNAAGSTSTYSGFGGLPGALDYARNVYESGKWILGALGSLSAAAMSHGGNKRGESKSLVAHMKPHEQRDDLSVRSWHTVQSSLRDDREEKTSSIGPGQPASGVLNPVDWDGTVEITYNDPDPDRHRYRRDGSPLASGDVSWNIQWFDVTNGVVDPDFPVSANGMTYISGGTINYNGSTGALTPSFNCQMIVPDGKRYMIRHVCSTGVTTARTMSFFELTSQCQTHYAG